MLYSRHSPEVRIVIFSGQLAGLALLGAVALYLAGALASRTHHDLVAALADAAGIVVCALAVWLSRGSEPQDVSPRGEPSPDPEPDPGDFDWGSFERGFRAYAARARTPASRR